MQALGERKAGVDGVRAHALACVGDGEPSALQHERGVGGPACEVVQGGVTRSDY